MKNLGILLVLAGFVTALVVGDRVLAVAGQYALSNSNDRFMKLYSGKYTAGVLVVGNSRADRHFPAKRLNKALQNDVANIGIGAESMVLAEILIRDYIDRVAPPQILIIEVSCLMVNPDRIGDMHFFGLYSSRIEAHTKSASPGIYYASGFLRLIHFNSGMFYRAAAGLFGSGVDRLHSATIGMDALSALRKQGIQSLQIHEENIAALERIISLSRQLGFPINLVVSPYLQVYEDGRQISTVKDWIENLQANLGSDNTLLDYSDLVTDSMHFRDRVHLNASGVRVFVDQLITDGILSVNSADIENDRTRWNDIWAETVPAR